MLHFALPLAVVDVHESRLTVGITPTSAKDIEGNGLSLLSYTSEESDMLILLLVDIVYPANTMLSIAANNNIFRTSLKDGLEIFNNKLLILSIILSFL